eukprot:3339236-Rhodomonas_salina.3
MGSLLSRNSLPALVTAAGKACRSPVHPSMIQWNLRALIVRRLCFWSCPHGWSLSLSDESSPSSVPRSPMCTFPALSQTGSSNWRSRRVSSDRSTVIMPDGVGWVHSGLSILARCGSSCAVHARSFIGSGKWLRTEPCAWRRRWTVHIALGCSSLSSSSSLRASETCWWKGRIPMASLVYSAGCGGLHSIHSRVARMLSSCSHCHSGSHVVKLSHSHLPAVSQRLSPQSPHTLVVASGSMKRSCIREVVCVLWCLITTAAQPFPPGRRCLSACVSAHVSGRILSTSVLDISSCARCLAGLARSSSSLAVLAVRWVHLKPPATDLKYGRCEQDRSWEAWDMSHEASGQCSCAACRIKRDAQKLPFPVNGS